MREIFYALLLVGCSFALTIPNGECQNFTLFNETDNSRLNESICAGNATIIYNITTNVTNTTIVQCNQTNATLWANDTITRNNFTVSCLFNITPPTICNNTTLNVTNITVVVNNSSCTIPTNYCYQNVNRVAGYSEVYRSDVCNITVISPANISVAGCLPYQYYAPCQVCTACAECPAQRECATPRICEPSLAGELLDCNNSLIIALSDLNATKEDYVHQLAARNEIIEGQKLALTTIDSTVEKKVEAKTGDVNDMYAYALVAGLCCTIFFVYKSRQPTHAPLSGVGEAITKERLDKLRAKRGGDTHDDVAGVQGKEPEA
jgi:hypothetical protein